MAGRKCRRKQQREKQNIDRRSLWRQTEKAKKHIRLSAPLRLWKRRRKHGVWRMPGENAVRWMKPVKNLAQHNGKTKA